MNKLNENINLKNENNENKLYKNDIFKTIELIKNDQQKSKKQIDEACEYFFIYFNRQIISLNNVVKDTKV